MLQQPPLSPVLLQPTPARSSEVVEWRPEETSPLAAVLDCKLREDPIPFRIASRVVKIFTRAE
jgi:hypothetical protein